MKALRVALATVTALGPIAASATSAELSAGRMLLDTFYANAVLRHHDISCAKMIAFHDVVDPNLYV